MPDAVSSRVRIGTGVYAAVEFVSDAIQRVELDTGLIRLSPIRFTVGGDVRRR